MRAATVMVKHKTSGAFPLAENGKLVGMLSLGDVHKAIFHANLTGALKSG